MSRELLERAAKAAGVSADDMELLWLAKQAEQSREISVEDVAACVEFYGHEIGWNPLIDDGDAFRLAVKLRMNIVIKRLPHAIYVETSNGSATSAMEVLADIRVGGLVGPYAATRLAIVRAAAAIWEAK